MQLLMGFPNYSSTMAMGAEMAGMPWIWIRHHLHRHCYRNHRLVWHSEVS